MGLSADDRLAATEVLHRYGHAYDEGDFDALGRCFAEDATFTIATTVGDMPSTMEGRAVIVATMRERRQSTQPAQRRHVITNVVLDEDGPDRIRAACYLLAGSTEGGALSLLSTGRYDDVLVRTATGWAITERTLRLDSHIA